MESELCSVPRDMKELGPRAVQRFRALVASAELPPPYLAALTALLHCYEASLFRALDFHDFTDLQSHHVTSQRTLACCAP